MRTSIPYQRRKCERLLAGDDLSRRELGEALAGIPGLAEWILERASSERFTPASVDAVLLRLGTAWVRRTVECYFAQALAAARG